MSWPGERMWILGDIGYLLQELEELKEEHDNAHTEIGIAMEAAQAADRASREVDRLYAEVRSRLRAMEAEAAAVPQVDRDFSQYTSDGKYTSLYRHIPIELRDEPFVKGMESAGCRVVYRGDRRGADYTLKRNAWGFDIYPPGRRWFNAKRWNGDRSCRSVQVLDWSWEERKERRLFYGWQHTEPPERPERPERRVGTAERREIDFGSRSGGRRKGGGCRRE